MVSDLRPNGELLTDTPDTNAQAAIVELQDVRVHYPIRRGDRTADSDVVRAVDGVSFSIPRGGTLGLVGGTGSGKSTIAQLIMGMVAPTSGVVRIGGHDAEAGRRNGRAQRRTVQVVLQDPFSSLDPRMKVGDIIAEPLTLGVPFRGRSARVTDRVAELLTLVGLSPAKAGAFPHQFSGGQRQRIAIARALAPAPELIVLDEPTSALDVSVRAQILNLLKSIQNQFGISYLVISHDLLSVAFLAQRVAVMWHGRIVEIGPMHDVYEKPGHPYTALLHASAPSADGKFFRLNQPPTGGALPIVQSAACPFAIRCELRPLVDSTKCIEEAPNLVEVGPMHQAACHFSNQVGLTELAPSGDLSIGGRPE